MSVDDKKNNDFAAMMQQQGDVKALQRDQRASDVSKAQAQAQAQLQLDKDKEKRRQAALGEASGTIDRLKTLPPEQYDASEIMGFKQGGLQEGVYKKLRTGKYEVDSKLDLHGLTVEQALKETLRFINNSIQAKKRCVLISHGKGIKREQPARLKNHLAAWLKHMPDVLAYHSAMPKQGGAGSVYVLLRKSEQSKQENRERFNKINKGKPT